MVVVGAHLGLEVAVVLVVVGLQTGTGILEAVASVAVVRLQGGGVHHPLAGLAMGLLMGILRSLQCTRRPLHLRQLQIWRPWLQLHHQLQHLQLLQLQAVGDLARGRWLTA